MIIQTDATGKISKIYVIFNFFNNVSNYTFITIQVLSNLEMTVYEFLHFLTFFRMDY